MTKRTGQSRRGVTMSLKPCRHVNGIAEVPGTRAMRLATRWSRQRRQIGIAKLVAMSAPWMPYVAALRVIEHVMKIVRATFVNLNHAAFVSAKILLRTIILDYA